jgi:hypothetical protein
MEYQNKPLGGQVYFDNQSGRYYTQTQPMQIPAFQNISNMWQPMRKTYLNEAPFGGNQSVINQLTQNRLPYQYSAPSAQQMFPGMGNPMMGTMPNQSQGNPMLGGGLFGAGRFLGGNYANQAGLLGTSVSGT